MFNGVNAAWIDLDITARYKTANASSMAELTVSRRGSMDDADPQTTYRHLVDLWTSGVRDYHSLLSDYLTANSIFVAAIGFLLSRRPLTLIFTLLVIILCLFVVLMTFLMASVLGRFSAQTALWEWRHGVIEGDVRWKQ